LLCIYEEWLKITSRSLSHKPVGNMRMFLSPARQLEPESSRVYATSSFPPKAPRGKRLRRCFAAQGPTPTPHLAAARAYPPPNPAPCHYMYGPYHTPASRPQQFVCQGACTMTHSERWTPFGSPCSLSYVTRKQGSLVQKIYSRYVVCYTF
jgi:hypothetical protein